MGLWGKGEFKWEKDWIGIMDRIGKWSGKRHREGSGVETLGNRGEEDWVMGLVRGILDYFIIFYYLNLFS